MNSSTGGTLLIGIADDGTITGVEGEYAIANSRKANWDGYELFLADLLNTSLSIANPFLHYALTRHTIQGHEVARIQVQPAPEPAYVKKKLYVRAHSQSIELQGPDLLAYIQTNWA